jgi:hypothetical protein
MERGRWGEEDRRRTEREEKGGKGEKIKIVQLLSKHVFFSLSFSLRTSDFSVQINVGRSGWLLLILALQLSNQSLLR